MYPEITLCNFLPAGKIIQWSKQSLKFSFYCKQLSLLFFGIICGKVGVELLC